MVDPFVFECVMWQDIGFGKKKLKERDTKQKKKKGFGKSFTWVSLVM